MDKEYLIIKKLKSIDDSSSTEAKTLIANSGIQFIDYEFDDGLCFNDQEFKDNLICNGYFKKQEEGQEKHLARYSYNKSINALQLCFKNEVSTADSVKEDGLGFQPITMPLLDSLKLYNGVWFPIPYFDNNCNDAPKNWARARVVCLGTTDGKQNGELFRSNNKLKFHVTLAFDTTVKYTSDFSSPNPDCIGSTFFSFRSGLEAYKLLVNSEDGTSFVRDWAEAIYDQVYKYANLEDSEIDSTIKEGKKNLDHEKHYLNMLGFLNYFVKPNDIQLVAPNSDSKKPIDVSLILDIGNSRSYGMLVEDNTKGNDEIGYYKDLVIRDLNAPENIYKGAFSSCIEYQKASFDFNNCSPLDSFTWLSLVRVGTEAKRLAAMNQKGDVNTGLVSPKRYLCDLTLSEYDSEWYFNPKSYQIPVLAKEKNKEKEKLFDVKLINPNANSRKFATFQPLTSLLTPLGDAQFATTGEVGKVQAKYSKKSSMTFMLMEIILQAMNQMNSLAYRQSSPNKEVPRRLKSVVLTSPPSMPDLEREVFRSCAYQAIGILWKAMGYDKSAPDCFNYLTNKDISPSVPNIILKWDETIAGQMVYLYNEVKKVYSGNCTEFFKEIRNPSIDWRMNEYYPTTYRNMPASYVGCRIASIDIGGGTTDLVIADYSYPKMLTENNEEIGDQSARINVREVLRDGFKIAGDDIVKTIIKDYIIAQIINNNPKINFSAVFGAASGDDVAAKNARVQALEQVFTKIAYRLIKRLEQLSLLKRGTTNVIASGSVVDFVASNDQCEKLDNALKDHGFVKVQNESDIDDEVIDFINQGVRQTSSDKEFDITQVQLSFDIYRLNQDIAEGDRFRNVSNNLNSLVAIVNAYACDVLLLNGGPTKIPGIRRFIEKKSFLNPYRIISMHNYRCFENWYPNTLTESGKIGDTKTTVVVGALLCYIKAESSSNLINFKINTDFKVAATPNRYFGALNDSQLKNKEICYKYRTNAEMKSEKYLESPSTEVFLAKLNEISDNFNDDDANQINCYYSKADDSAEGAIYKSFAIDLGYRQFDDEAFAATRLFTIKPYENINSLAIVRLVQKIYLPSKFTYTEEGKKDPEFVKMIESFRAVFPNDESYENAILKEFEQNIAESNAYAEQAAKDAKNNYVLEAESYAQSKSQENTGFLSKFKSAKSKEAEKQAFKDEYLSRPDIVDKINNDTKRLIAEKTSSLDASFYAFVFDKMSKANQEITEMANTMLVKIKQRAQHEEAELNLEAYTIKNESDIINDPVYRCIKFICDEEKQCRDYKYISNLKDVVFFKYKPQRLDERNYYELRLNTNQDELYWNNSGLIF